MSWFSRPDYHAGSVIYTREALFLRLNGEVRHRDASIPSLSLFHDRGLLVMRHDLAQEFDFKCRISMPTWREEVCDCDDLEALYRAARIRYRLKAGLRVPEAFGGVDYIRQDGGCHRAAWALTDEGLWIVDPATGIWRGARGEVKEAIYFDA